MDPIELVRQRQHDLGNDLVKAQGRQEAHEDVCAERYKHIAHQLTSLHERISVMDATVSGRLNAISNRMWGAAIGVCGTAVLGMAVLVFHLLTRGKV